MSDITDLYRDLYNNDLSAFKQECAANQITQKAEHLSSSAGEAINRINMCLDSFNEYCQNLNEVYRSTAVYLDTVIGNLNQFDSDCTIN